MAGEGSSCGTPHMDESIVTAGGVVGPSRSGALPCHTLRPNRGLSGNGEYVRWPDEGAGSATTAVAARAEECRDAGSDADKVSRGEKPPSPGRRLPLTSTLPSWQPRRG